MDDDAVDEGSGGFEGGGVVLGGEGLVEGVDLGLVDAGVAGVEGWGEVELGGLGCLLFAARCFGLQVGQSLQHAGAAAGEAEIVDEGGDLAFDLFELLLGGLGLLGEGGREGFQFGVEGFDGDGDQVWVHQLAADVLHHLRFQMRAAEPAVVAACVGSGGVAAEIVLAEGAEAAVAASAKHLAGEQMLWTAPSPESAWRRGIVPGLWRYLHRERGEAVLDPLP